MAFEINDSIRYTGVETGDAVFSKVLIELLFKDFPFVPGETYSNKYEERAGQIFIRKLGKIATKLADATQAGGLDFTHTQARDTLLTLIKKDVISVSEKIYAMIDDLRASGKSVDKIATAINSWKERWQILIMNYLLAPVNVEGGGASRSPNTVASTNSETLIDSILKDRESIRISGGVADVLLISPEMETYFLSDWAKGRGFIPETNEDALRTGRIGKIFGLKVITTNLLGAGVPLTDDVEQNTGVASSTEYIMYDHRVLGIAVDIEGLRLKADDGSFIGTFAQMMGLSGGIVTNPALAIAKVIAPEA